MVLAVLLAFHTAAFAGVDDALWQEHLNQQVAIQMSDGSQLVGVLVEIQGDQLKVKKQTGAVVLVPKGMARSVNGKSKVAAPVPAPRPAPVVAPRTTAPAPINASTPVFSSNRSPVLKRLGTRLVGVRYRIGPQDLGEHLFWDQAGNANPMSSELNRTRSLRDYVFVDEDGVPLSWQAGWSRMGAEREYVDLVKDMNKQLIPIQALEVVLAVPGFAMMAYSSYSAQQNATVPYEDPLFIGGATMIIANVVVGVALHGPTKQRLRADIGKKGIKKARDYYQPPRHSDPQRR